MDEKSRSRAKRFLSLCALSSTAFFAALSHGLLAPLYPQEAELRNVTATEYGPVFGAFSFVTLLASPFFAKHLFVLGMKATLGGGFAIAGFSVFAFGLLDLVESHDLFLCLSCAARGFQALGTAAATVACFSITAAIFPGAIATFFATVEIFTGFGFIVGPVVGGYLFEVGGFQMPYMVIGPLVLLAGVLAHWTLSELEGSKPESTVRVADVASLPSVALNMASVASVGLGFGFLMPTLEPHLRQFELRAVDTGYVFICSAVTYMLTASVIGRLCDKYVDPGKMVTLGHTFVTLAFIVVGPACYIPVEPELWITCVGLALLGLGFSCVYLPAFTASLRSAVKGGLPDDPSTFGVVAGVLTASFSAGTFIGPVIGGYLLDQYGFRTATFALVVVHVVLLILRCLFACVTQCSAQHFIGLSSSARGAASQGDTLALVSDTDCEATALSRQVAKTTSYGATSEHSVTFFKRYGDIDNNKDGNVAIGFGNVGEKIGASVRKSLDNTVKDKGGVVKKLFGVECTPDEKEKMSVEKETHLQKGSEKAEVHKKTSISSGLFSSVKNIATAVSEGTSAVLGGSENTGQEKDNSLAGVFSAVQNVASLVSEDKTGNTARSKGITSSLVSAVLHDVPFSRKHEQHYDVTETRGSDNTVQEKENIGTECLRSVTNVSAVVSEVGSTVPRGETTVVEVHTNPLVEEETVKTRRNTVHFENPVVREERHKKMSFVERHGNIAAQCKEDVSGAVEYSDATTVRGSRGTEQCDVIAGRRLVNIAEGGGDIITRRITTVKYSGATPTTEDDARCEYDVITTRGSGNSGQEDVVTRRVITGQHSGAILSEKDDTNQYEIVTSRRFGNSGEKEEIITRRVSTVKYSGAIPTEEDEVFITEEPGNFGQQGEIITRRVSTVKYSGAIPTGEDDVFITEESGNSGQKGEIITRRVSTVKYSGAIPKGEDDVFITEESGNSGQQGEIITRRVSTVKYSGAIPTGEDDVFITEGSGNSGQGVFTTASSGVQFNTPVKLEDGSTERHKKITLSRGHSTTSQHSDSIMSELINTVLHDSATMSREQLDEVTIRTGSGNVGQLLRDITSGVTYTGHSSDATLTSVDGDTSQHDVIIARGSGNTVELGEASSARGYVSTVHYDVAITNEDGSSTQHNDVTMMISRGNSDQHIDITLNDDSVALSSIIVTTLQRIIDDNVDEERSTTLTFKE